MPLVAPMPIASLTCERRSEPLGVDVAAPRLAWTLTAGGQNRRQTAYEIRVGSRPGSQELWESGKQASDESAGVPYAGRPLGSSQRVYWQVRVWDEGGRVGPWSGTGSWTMGVVRPDDWQARWIGGADAESLLLRKEFSVKAGLQQAIVHVTGMGQYEMRLNGQKVGNDLLTPGWTDYRKTVLYDTYDVTSLLKKGTNAAGLLLGNGMDNVHGPRYAKFTGTFGPHRALAQLRLVYADGHAETVGTDGTWTTHAGPITFSSVFGGEDYDLRLEPKGWTQTGFKDAWAPATVVAGPGGSLRGLGAPAVRAVDTLVPIGTKTIRDGVQTVDLGQNASIMLRLVASGPSGSAVRVTPAELVYPDGSIDRRSVGGGQAYWQVTLDGSATTFSSKFFYHGCRYLQVERLPDAQGRLPQVQSVAGLVVGSSAPAVGDFASSSDLLNRIHTLVRWAQRNNTVSVLTDCPHRERLGWLEQAHLNGPSLRYEHDLSTLFDKIAGDMADAQRANGLVPDIAPEYAVFGGGFVDSPEWGSAAVVIPWQQYLWHRDRALLARQYDSMKHYVEYLRSKATGGIVPGGLGDWYDLGPGDPGFAQLTPIPLTATAFYYQDAAILVDAATILGKKADVALFAAERDAIRLAFNETFFDEAKGYYGTGSQTANAIPLVMGLAESNRRAGVLAQLAADVASKGNTSGDVGYRYVLRALAEGGRSDLILAMSTQSDRPGYAYQLAQGATSLTESWSAGTTSSQDHFMLGPIVEWLYADLAGIQPIDGYKHFLLRPTPVAGLTSAKASYRSEYGTIGSAWHQDGATIVYDFVVPPNSSATVQIPGQASREVGSGQYRFSGGLAQARLSPSGQMGRVGPIGAFGALGASGAAILVLVSRRRGGVLTPLRGRAASRRRGSRRSLQAA